MSLPVVRLFFPCRKVGGSSVTVAELLERSVTNVLRSVQVTWTEWEEL